MAQSTAAPALPRARIKISANLERSTAFALLAFITFWLIINLVNSPSSFFTSVVIGLSLGALYALLALGYSLVYGIIELINFAHGDLFMLGTLFSALLIGTVFRQTHVGAGGWLALVAALVLTMIFCGGINMIIEFLAYRRLRHAPRLAPLITAIGMSFVLQYIGLKWNGSAPKSVPSVLPSGAFTIGGVRIDYDTLIVVGVTIPILLGMVWMVSKTRFGRAMRATAQDSDAARLMGINVNRIISLTFGLGGALAGVAAVIYEQDVGTVRYNLGYELGLIAFTAAVLGGIGNFQGAVLGGVLIGLVQALNEGVHYGGGQRWTDVIVFAILILVLVFRPNGLLGRSQKEKV